MTERMSTAADGTERKKPGKPLKSDQKHAIKDSNFCNLLNKEKGHPVRCKPKYGNQTGKPDDHKGKHTFFDAAKLTAKLTTRVPNNFRSRMGGH